MLKNLLTIFCTFFGLMGNANADVGEVGTVGYLSKVCKIETRHDIESTWDQGYSFGTMTASMRTKT